MNEKVMRKHYEATPKETLINILISSREQVDKLQNRNKERKLEIERLKELCDKYEEEHKTTFEEWKKTINIINELEKYINEDDWTSVNGEIAVRLIKLKLQELKGSDKE